MKVKNWMVKKVVTVKRDATVQEALDIMQKRAIRHMPVLGEDGKSVAGLVTENNLRQFYLLSMVEKISVRDVMIVEPITIDANASIEQAAGLIHRHKIGCLPAVEKNKLVGIITVTDILAAFIEMMGLLKASSRIDLVIKEDSGSIEEISHIIKDHKKDIISIGIQNRSSGKRIHHIRLEKCDLRPIVKSLESAGYEIVSVMK